MRYVKWLGDFVTGDFGVQFSSDGAPVADLIKELLGLVSIDLDRADAKHPELDEWVAATGRDVLLGEGSPFAMASSWRPVIPARDAGRRADCRAPAPAPGRGRRNSPLDTEPAEEWDQVHGHAKTPSRRRAW